MSCQFGIVSPRPAACLPGPPFEDVFDCLRQMALLIRVLLTAYEKRRKVQALLNLDKEAKLMKALNGNLEHLRSTVIASNGAGLRKSKLIRLTADHIKCLED